MARSERALTPAERAALAERVCRARADCRTVLVKTGHKLVPIRIVPAATKRMMEVPEHLTVIGAPLDRIEDALTHAR